MIAIWRDYSAFENNRNKTLASALLNEFGPKYMDARVAYRERKNYYDAVVKHALATPPTGTRKETSLVLQWKRVLSYEKKVPKLAGKLLLRAINGVESTRIGADGAQGSRSLCVQPGAACVVPLSRNLVRFGSRRETARPRSIQNEYQSLVNMIRY